MTNAETILELLENYPKGVCDGCISRETRIEPLQQVNQICHQLERNGKIQRSGDHCSLCGRMRKVNIIRIGRSGREVERLPTEATTGSEVPRVSIEALWKHLDRFCKALADKHKVSNGRSGLAALISVLTDRGAVPMHQANMMHTIRGLRNAYVHDDIPIGKRETAIAEAAWDIVHIWAESHEGELWRRTRA